MKKTKMATPHYTMLFQNKLLKGGTTVEKHQPHLVKVLKQFQLVEISFFGDFQDMLGDQNPYLDGLGPYMKFENRGTLVLFSAYFTT